MTGTRTTLLYEQWPSGDQALWNAANAKGDFLEADGPAAGWTSKTRIGVTKRYGLWLGFLHSRGELIEEINIFEKSREHRWGYKTYCEDTEDHTGDTR